MSSLLSMDQPSEIHPQIVSPARQFLDNAKKGSSRWWVWIVGTVLIAVVWMGIGSIPIATSCSYAQSVDLVDFWCDGFEIRGISSLPAFVIGTYSFVLGMIGIWFVARSLHRRRLTSVVTGRASFDYGRAFFALLVGIVVFGAPTLSFAALYPDLYVFQSPNVWEYTTFFAFAIVLIPVQAGFEEVFFRGYLMQGIALLNRNRAVLAIVTGVIFSLVHIANPEPWEYGVVPYLLSILSLGTFFGLLTLIDGGIELAAGIHIANNLIFSLLATTSVSVVQTPALFLVGIEEYRIIPDVLVLWLTLGIVFVSLNLRYRWLGYGRITSIWRRRAE